MGAADTGKSGVESYLGDVGGVGSFSGVCDDVVVIQCRQTNYP